MQEAAAARQDVHGIEISRADNNDVYELVVNIATNNPPIE